MCRPPHRLLLPSQARAEFQLALGMEIGPRFGDVGDDLGQTSFQSMPVLALYRMP